MLLDLVIFHNICSLKGDFEVHLRHGKPYIKLTNYCWKHIYKLIYDFTVPQMCSSTLINILLVICIKQEKKKTVRKKKLLKLMASYSDSDMKFQYIVKILWEKYKTFIFELERKKH